MPRPQPIRMKAGRRAADTASAMLGLPANGRAADPSRLPRPAAGESSGPQGTLFSPGAFPFGAGGYGGMGGYGGYGMGLAGFGDFQRLWQSAFPGMPFGFAGSWWQSSMVPGVPMRRLSFMLYRLMDLDPTLSLVYKLITGPILASTWTVKPRDGIRVVGGAAAATRESGRITAIPKAWIDFVSDQLLPLRQSVLAECLRYMSTGWMPFERVYELRAGPGGRKCLWLKKLKPLLPDTSSIVDAGGGNFGGVIAGATMDARKSFIVTHAGQVAAKLYGMSRHEAAFPNWMQGEYAGVRRAVLTAKVSGTLPILYYRPGETNLGGKMTDNGSIANSILSTLQIGNGVAVPCAEFTEDELQMNPELMKTSSWRLDVVDAGSYAPAIVGMLAEQDHHDVRKIRAWGWPERAVVEAQKGGIGSGDAEQHSDSASVDRECVDDDLASQLSFGQPLYDVPGVVDEIVALNLDPDAKGVLSIHPAPLVDSKAKVYSGILTAALGNPILAAPLASVFDWPDLLTHLDIATTDDLKEKLPQLLSAAADQQRQQAEAQTASTRAAVTAATAKPNSITVPGGVPPVGAGKGPIPGKGKRKPKATTVPPVAGDKLPGPA